ncbi:MAG: hypothetical protein C3F15_12580 [Holophagae bacterium]|nr:MAG: hypothetical protein C3F15_12580 [Holophagae bacterium]
MARRAQLGLLLLLSLSAPLLADDGDLDPSFWMDGTMTVDATADVSFGGLATDPGGRLAVAYSYIPPTGGVGIGVWRSVGDVSLGGACVLPGSQGDVRVWDAAFDAFGRLLVVASASYSDGMMDWEAWFALAYEYPDCVLDTAFGGDGIVTLSGWDMAGLQSYSRLRALADGNTLVTGSALSGGPDGCRAHVISLEPDGSWGPTYCAPPDAFPVEAYGIDSAVAPNGHVVSIASGPDFWVVDFEPGGSIAGVVAVPFDLGGDNNDDAKAVAVTGDGRIVVVGSAQLSGRFVMTAHAIAVLHWNAAGVLVLDPDFSGDGKLTFDFNGWTWNGLESVEVQGDGKIVVAGSSMPVGGDYAMAVARLLPDGSFDGDFVPSQPGWRIVDFDLVPPPAHDRAYRVALQNGRIVLAGIVALTTDVDSVGVARLLNSYVFGDGFEIPQAPGWLWVD